MSTSLSNRPERPHHRDDKPYSFNALICDLKNDPYLMIHVCVYSQNGTILTHDKIYMSQAERNITENAIHFIRDDTTITITNTDELDQNWYTNRMGFILKVYRE